MGFRGVLLVAEENDRCDLTLSTFTDWIAMGKVQDKKTTYIVRLRQVGCSVDDRYEASSTGSFEVVTGTRDVGPASSAGAGPPHGSHADVRITSPASAAAAEGEAQETAAPGGVVGRPAAVPVDVQGLQSIQESPIPPAVPPYHAPALPAYFPMPASPAPVMQQTRMLPPLMPPMLPPSCGLCGQLSPPFEWDERFDMYHCHLCGTLATREHLASACHFQRSQNPGMWLGRQRGQRRPYQ